VEHIVSNEADHFASKEELIAAIVGVLTAQAEKAASD
jgi:hypothetical protein